MRREENNISKRVMNMGEDGKKKKREAKEKMERLYR
jgi:hypothetical protein